MKWVRVVAAVLLCLVLLVGATSCATSGESPQDGVKTDTTPPSSPTNVARTTPDNDSTPTFTWAAATDDGSGIARYLARIDNGGWIDVGKVTTYTCVNAVSDGSHTFGVKAVDEAGNEGSEAGCTFTCDTTPPTISRVGASGTTISSAVITWSTDESATSQVEYGTTSGYGSSSPLDSSLITTHNVKLTGLEPGTTYHYRVRSKDAGGKEASSGDNTFSTVPSAYAVYCVGDSLTAADVYEARLRELLGSSVEVINKGGGGAHTSDMLSLLKADVLPNHPGFVIVWGGINDILNPECSLDDTKANLQAMYTQAHNQGIQVIAVNISPCKGWSEWTESAQAAIDDVNAWIATTAVDVDYKIDVYSLLEDPANPDCLLWPDYGSGGGGLHLSEAGYNRVAQAIYDGTAAFHG